MPLLPRLRPHAGVPLGSCGAVNADAVQGRVLKYAADGRGVAIVLLILSKF